MRLLLGVFLFVGVLSADTIWPALPPVPPGTIVGYFTVGATNGVTWDAGWFPSGPTSGVWAIGFSEPITSYTVLLSYQIAATGYAAYVSGESTLTEESTWIDARTLQLSGDSNPETGMYIITSGGPPSIYFTGLTSADAPEPDSAMLALAIFPAVLLVRRFRQGTTTTRSGPV